MNITIDIPANEWISANSRMHWAPRKNKTKALRARGKAIALAARIGHLGPTHVVTHVGYPRNGRADPSNASPVQKALIDGFVDAGVWPDDDHTNVIDGGYRRGPTTGIPGVHTITFELTEHTA